MSKSTPAPKIVEVRLRINHLGIPIELLGERPEEFTTEEYACFASGQQVIQTTQGMYELTSPRTAEVVNSLPTIRMIYRLK